MLVGGLYCVAARGLAQSPRTAVGPPVVPALILGTGAGLIGSGVFVTDPVAGFPPSVEARDGAPPPSDTTRAGRLHNLCAVPVFVGIPAAALTCARSAARRREYRWAAVEQVVMTRIDSGRLVIETWTPEHGLVRRERD